MAVFREAIWLSALMSTLPVSKVVGDVFWLQADRAKAPLRANERVSEEIKAGFINIIRKSLRLCAATSLSL